MQVNLRAIKDMPSGNWVVILWTMKEFAKEQIKQARETSDPNAISVCQQNFYSIRRAYGDVKSAINSDRSFDGAVFEMAEWPDDLQPKFPCAVEGCENEGQAHTCMYDGADHRHGRIHYNDSRAGKTEHNLTFRKDAWHLICNEHYDVLVKDFESRKRR